MRLRAVILLLSLAGLALAQPYRIPPQASGAAVWGLITGDINSQADLIAAIAAGGNPGFGALVSGTNSGMAAVCSTGCSMTTAGTGTIDANTLGGVLLSGLDTGLLKNTAGIPSIGIAGTDYALPSIPGYQPNQIIGGCAVEYISGLTYSVGQCNYTINGGNYNSALAPVTLAAADPTNPRIDVIGVDTSGAPFVTTGTPSTPAAQPALTALQLGLSIAYVPAGSSTPQGVTVGDIYEENTEWTSAVTANFNAASTSNPYRGSKDIEATTAALTNSVTLVKPTAGTENLSAWNTLSFYIRSKALWPSGNGANAARWISIFWLNGSTQIGALVQLKDGAFGFNSATTGAYQQISIPLSLFQTGSNLVTSLKFQITGNGGATSIGFYLDAITLQGGTNGIALPTTLMNFRGAYNTTTAYNPNDVVTSGGSAYVALLSNTNIALTITTAWAPLAGSSVLTTRSDLLTLNSSLAPIRLAKGTQYQTLQGGASDIAWGAVNLAQGTAVTGLLGLGNGGLGFDATATGGTSQVLKQTSVGAALSVARLNCADLSDSSSGCSSAAPTAPTHSFTCTIGSASGTTVITTGDTGCYSDGGSFTGTINRADIIGNAASLATCSITVDVWLASGAYPTSSDKISASAPATLSGAKSNFNFTRTGWSNTVSSNPMWGASVASVTGCVYAQVRVEFQ